MSKRNFNLLSNFLFKDWEEELNETLTITTNKMIQGMRRLSISDDKRSIKDKIDSANKVSKDTNSNCIFYYLFLNCLVDVLTFEIFDLDYIVNYQGSQSKVNKKPSIKGNFIL